MGLRNSGGYGSSYGGGWLWNSMFGLYTFVPNRGMAYSPFGFGFWSPYTVGNYYSYYNPGHYNSGGGGSTYRPPAVFRSNATSAGIAANRHLFIIGSKVRFRSTS